jgi:rhomboid protease GluP
MREGGRDEGEQQGAGAAKGSVPAWPAGDAAGTGAGAYGIGAVEDLPGALSHEPEEAPPVELWSAVGNVTPWGTMLLLLAWAVVFALTAARGELGDTAALTARGANTLPLGAWDAAWRWLASTFLHESPSHVFFNALSLLVFGQAVERIYARGGFALVGTVGGAAASAGSLLWRLQRGAGDVGMSIGGSGLVFALGGALLVAAVRLRRHLAVGRARALGAVILLLTLPGFSAGFQRHATDNAAHGAGLLAGMLLGAVVPLRAELGGPPRSRATAVLGALAAAALFASFVLVLKG